MSTSGPERPQNRWQLLRWDAAVFALAAAGFFVNWRWPYELSSTMMVVFAAAMAWVAYRMYQSLQQFKRTEPGPPQPGPAPAGKPAKPRKH